MAKISINLLPAEFSAEQLKRAKFVKIQAIGVSVVLLMIFLSSLTFSLSILQNQSIKAASARVLTTEEKIAGLKGTQASLIFLKNRLDILQKYLGTQSKTVSLYQFFTNQLPSSASADSISVDKEGNMLLLIRFQDIGEFDSLLVNLLDPQKNEGRIKKISIDSFSRGRDGLFRISLKLEPA